MKIPQIIHYCWFGEGKKPDIFNQCLDSWKKMCPNYQIIEWSELNFDVNKNDFTREAYEKKDWASVSDYVRIFVLHEFGGVYLDIDVELIKSIEPLLNNDSFVGTEGFASINNGLIYGSKRKDVNLSNLLKIYNDSDKTSLFDNEVRIVTNYFHDNGYRYYSNKVQLVNGCRIYPHEYFCPKPYGAIKEKITDKTYAIHHYNASWVGYKMNNKVRRHIVQGKILRFILTPKLYDYMYNKYLESKGIR